MATPLPFKLPSGRVLYEYPDRERCIANVPRWAEMIVQERAAMEAETDPDRIAKYEKLMDVMQETLVDFEAMANMEYPED